MERAPSPPVLTVKEAAARLGMTAQGVRKAVREHRLDGTTRLLPSGKREYTLAEQAVEAFRSGQGSPLEARVETLSMQLELAEGAVHERDLEIVALRSELEVVRRDLRRTTRALRLQLHAFEELAFEDETQDKANDGAV